MVCISFYVNMKIKEQKNKRKERKSDSRVSRSEDMKGYLPFKSVCIFDKTFKAQEYRSDV